MLTSTCNFLNLENVPIFTQLQIEEALLRSNTQNWCLLNTGSSPAVVLGISGKLQELLFIDNVKEDNIPVIKRFSGGGTVFIEPSTIFITWIINNDACPIMPFSESILTWAKDCYDSIFPEDFNLKDNDYCVANKKIGGNALYIQKNRWLLHSSFLWDFNNHLMNRYLKLPKQQPLYRQSRNHNDFLEKLSHFYSDKQTFLSALKNHVKSLGNMIEVDVATIIDMTHSNHRKTTQLLSLENTN